MDFAIKGMNFNQYTENPIFLRLYARYFLYMELERATHIYAAYEQERLLGLLLAEVQGAPKQAHTFLQASYVKLVNFLMKTFFADSSGRYDAINQTLFARYQEAYQPDGEIIFLAADPDNPVKGVGSQLLSAFEKDLPQREIYLYTDSNCNYPFYEKRGFERFAQEEILLDTGKKQASLTCFLYRKRID